MNNGIFSISTGAGFLPATVVHHHPEDWFGSLQTARQTPRAWTIHVGLLEKTFDLFRGVAKIIQISWQFNKNKTRNTCWNGWNDWNLVEAKNNMKHLLKGLIMIEICLKLTFFLFNIPLKGPPVSPVPPSYTPSSFVDPVNLEQLRRRCGHKLQNPQRPQLQLTPQLRSWFGKQFDQFAFFEKLR